MEDQYYDIQRRTEIRDTARELRRKHLRYKDGLMTVTPEGSIKAEKVDETVENLLKENDGIIIFE